MSETSTLTPAELLAAAADRLVELAGEATRGPWRQFVDPRFGPQASIGTPDGSLHIGTGGPRYTGAENAAWIAAMHPGVAGPLAAWLRDEMDAVRQLTASGLNVETDAGAECTKAALDFARIVLGVCRRDPRVPAAGGRERA